MYFDLTFIHMIVFFYYKKRFKLDFFFKKEGINIS
jgi:hypothetical protein